MMENINKVMSRKKIAFALVVLSLFVVFSAFVSAAYTYTSSFSGFGSGYSSASYQYQPDFQTYYGSSTSTYWPILTDKETCTARQDIVLQTAPGGCQPMVVRSDLIADQNVPVFCQIDALQLNPLIDIKSIRNIQFTGTYPKEVVNVGFHPARAALSTRDKLMGNPVINNIGYAVVVLKRTPNESSLPNSVAVNLTGKIEYDAGNAYGIGTNVFYISPTSEQDWALEKEKNSFWNGKYFVRVEDADIDFAIISLYDGVNKIATRRIKLGQQSDPIYLPGIYCQFGLVLAYNKYDSADTKARIEISDEKGTDTIDVYKGTPFLNGKCSVRDIYVDSNGQTGNVRVVCGSDSFILQRAAVVNVAGLEGGKVSHSYTDNLEICGVNFNDGSGYQITRQYDPKRKESLIGGWSELKGLKDSDPTKLGSKSDEIRNNLIKSCELRDDKIDPDVADSAFKDATLTYQSVADNYPNEATTSGNGANTYGLLALQYALEVVKEAKGKGYNLVETEGLILNKLISLYPSLAYQYKSRLDDAFSVDSSSSIRTIQVDNKFRTMRLVSVQNPSDQDKATIKASLGGKTINNWKINDSVSVAGWANASINLTQFNARTATFSTRCPTEGTYSYNSNRNSNQKNELTSLHTFSVNIGESMVVCGQPLAYIDNDLKKVAQVTIAPNVYGPETSTNFTVKIGIEKRAIKLSPDEAKDKIKTLNESIKKWESISANLVKVETSLKGACFATAAALTVKNFITGMGGTGASRQEVMSGNNGWNKRCEESIKTHKLDVKGNGVADKDVSYSSVTQCIFDNKAAIENEVNARAKAYTDTNNVIKETVEKAPGVKDTNGNVNQNAAMDELYKKIHNECPGSYKNLQSKTERPAGSSEKYYYPYTYSELVDYYKNCKVAESGYGNLSAIQALNSTFDRAKKSADDYAAYSKSIASGDLKKYAIGSSDSNTIKSGTMMDVKDGTIKGVNAEYGNLNQGDNIVEFNGDSAFLLSGKKVSAKDDKGKDQTLYKDVLVVGNKVGNQGQFTPTEAYIYEWNEAHKSAVLTPLEQFNSDKYVKGGVTTFLNENGISQLKSAGQGLFGNVIRQEDRKVLYFASGSDKDLPSQVPFDVSNGWYVKVESASLSLGSNSVASYDSSGMPKRWQICNVGDDGMVNSADQCQEVINGQNDKEGMGLDQKTWADIVLRSKRAILDAGSQKGSARKSVNILGQEMGTDYTDPASNVQCSNFMSPGDCQLLYNVCDPVICPPSRCDLGGTYRVANVQQTGIVGSALLCAPNIREGIYLPVCISGIRNGIDSFVSLLKQHRDCLQQNVNDGRLVGICDEIQSIYMCEFFWRQAAPIANMLLPKAIEAMSTGTTGTTKGGGEYLFTQKAWDNAKSGMDYFTQYYAQNSMKAFQIRSVEEAGTQVCKGFISASVPTSFKTLLQPDSPPQFTARFDETTYSTVTVPATSQYKVFYFINAGKDSGTYYSVYLKTPPDSGYYYSAQQVMVASGFIAKGQSVSETKDFTAPQGYKELCVRVNDQEECGFKQVSTDFAVNYLTDKYAQDQLTNSNVKTSAECTSGTASLMAVGANLNLQSAAEEAALPSIAQRGIIRICATQNPAANSNPTRYVDVGYCGDTKMRCWLDKNSVNNAITDSNIGIKNETLSYLENLTIQQLMENNKEILNASAANEKIKGIVERVDALSRRASVQTLSLKAMDEIINDARVLENDIADTSAKLVYNNHKAELAYQLGRVKQAKFESYLNAGQIRQKINSAVTASSVVQTGCDQYTDLDLSEDAYYSDGTIYRFDDSLGNYYYLRGDKLIYSKNDYEVTPGTSGFNSKNSDEQKWTKCLYDNLIAFRKSLIGEASVINTTTNKVISLFTDGSTKYIMYGAEKTGLVVENNVVYYSNPINNIAKGALGTYAPSNSLIKLNPDKVSSIKSNIVGIIGEDNYQKLTTVGILIK